MSITSSTVGCSQVSVEGKIIRANGTVEELGFISYWNSDPEKQLAWEATQKQELSTDTN